MTVSKLSNLRGYSIKDLRHLFAYSQGDAVFWHNLLRSGEGDFRTRHAGCPVLQGWKWGKFDILDYKSDKGRLAGRKREDLNQLKNQVLEYAPTWPAWLTAKRTIRSEIECSKNWMKEGHRSRMCAQAFKHETF